VRADVLRLGATQVEERDARALELGFRVSALTDGEVVVQAEFRAAPGDAVAARAEIDEIVRWRREHQPGGQNCGSVFVNPDGDSAGRLIEECGLKGARVGGAVVSEKHANFVQAEPGATAADIVALAELVRARVHERTGRWMRAELRLVGFDGVVLDAPPGPPMRHQNAREDA
jgi:UDP-N-acetylmuramate dehydrogenase